jgi:nucleotide-binding universal stress UspA family protein
LQRQGQHLFPGAPETTKPDREALTRKILVPTNFSPASNLALDRAVALANQCHAVLTILHVIDINTQSEFGTAEEIWTQLIKDSSMQMGELAGSLCDRVDAQTVLEEGLPGDTIVRMSNDFDLIILGNVGRRSGWFSKHTVRRVLDEAACPVMVVRKSG